MLPPGYDTVCQFDHTYVLLVPSSRQMFSGAALIRHHTHNQHDGWIFLTLFPPSLSTTPQPVQRSAEVRNRPFLFFFIFFTPVARLELQIKKTKTEPTFTLHPWLLHDQLNSLNSVIDNVNIVCACVFVWKFGGHFAEIVMTHLLTFTLNLANVI